MIQVKNFLIFLIFLRLHQEEAQHKGEERDGGADYEHLLDAPGSRRNAQDKGRYSLGPVVEH